MANNAYYGNLLTREEAAKYLGVSPQTILNYVNRGLLSAVNLSHGTRPVYGFQEEVLIDFDMRKKKIKSGRRKPRTKVAKPSKEELQKDLDHVKEIAVLKAKLKMLSEELLNVSIKLDEMSM